MDIPTSLGVRVVMSISIVVLVCVVYAQTHVNDVVAFAQWFTGSVIEDKFGITKEMLEGK